MRWVLLTLAFLVASLLVAMVIGLVARLGNDEESDDDLQ